MEMGNSAPEPPATAVGLAKGVPVLEGAHCLRILQGSVGLRECYAVELRRWQKLDRKAAHMYQRPKYNRSEVRAGTSSGQLKQGVVVGADKQHALFASLWRAGRGRGAGGGARRGGGRAGGRAAR